MNKENLYLALRFSIPLVFTAPRVLLGGCALLAANLHQGILAAKLMSLGAVTDVLDGTLARKLRVTTEFGALFDYSADYLCYIVAPATVSSLVLIEHNRTLSLVAFGLPLLAGAIRYSRNAGLVRTQASAEMGLPSAGTVFYAFFIVALVYLDSEGMLGTVLLNRLVLIAVSFFSVLMVVPVRYPKHSRFKWVYPPVLLGLILMPFVFTRILAASTLVFIFS